MNNYDEMSDLEINKLVAEKEGRNPISTPASDVDGNTLSTGSVVASPVALPHNVVKWYYHDYCNLWKDMGLIIFENWIAVVCPTGQDMLWRCHDFTGEIEYHHENPLRAAAIVYLMTGDTK